MLVERTNSGLVLYNHANFYRFEERSSYWSVKRISVFLSFSLANQRHTSGITVYNCTVTNIENTVRAVHSCNSWFKFKSKFEHFVTIATYDFKMKQDQGLKELICRRFVRPSQFYPDHISKNVEGNLMKCYTLIEGYEVNCRMQEP